MNPTHPKKIFFFFATCDVILQKENFRTLTQVPSSRSEQRALQLRMAPRVMMSLVLLCLSLGLRGASAMDPPHNLRTEGLHEEVAFISETAPRFSFAPPAVDAGAFNQLQQVSECGCRCALEVCMHGCTKYSHAECPAMAVKPVAVTRPRTTPLIRARNVMCILTSVALW